MTHLIFIVKYSYKETLFGDCQNNRMFLNLSHSNSFFFISIFFNISHNMKKYVLYNAVKPVLLKHLIFISQSIIALSL